MTWNPEKKILALCGGVGGAKLALGLSKILSPDQLTVVVNTGDDFTHLGLPISPDLDTVTYTLAGINNQLLGWGQENETWHCMEALERMGADTWFQLGDKDIALHLRRRQLIEEGKSLEEITHLLSERLGIAHTIIPMSNEPVRTLVETDIGTLPFQHYFVREQCKPVVKGFIFENIEHAKPSEGFVNALGDPNLAGIIICPSNPFVSIAPVLELPTLRRMIQNSLVPVIAVTPIVGGKAIKGPAAKMLNELNLPLSPVSVANCYAGLLHGFIVDSLDQNNCDRTEFEVPLHFCNTLMNTLDDRIDLATRCTVFIDDLSETNPDDPQSES